MPITQTTLIARLAAAEIAIDNALANQGILDALNIVGIDLPYMETGRQHLTSAQTLLHQQQAAYGHLFSVTDSHSKALADAKLLYNEHVFIARIALKHDRGALQRLGLVGERSQKRSECIAQARQFYTNALEDADVLAQLERRTLSREMLETGLQKVEHAADLYAIKCSCSGDAQAATCERNKACSTLDSWMQEFKSIAQIALKQQPASLKKLGFAAMVR
jgi:hypothetical protein